MGRYHFVCRFCGKEFSDDTHMDRKFCSRECFYSGRGGKKKQNPKKKKKRELQTFTCEECGYLFQAKKERKFCTKNCLRKNQKMKKRREKMKKSLPEIKKEIYAWKITVITKNGQENDRFSLNHVGSVKSGLEKLKKREGLNDVGQISIHLKSQKIEVS